MEIKTYNITQLYDLIHSEEFKKMSVVPISTHRAISHIHNPRAAPDDVLMIIAYENGDMIGYLGVLADRIYNIKGEGYKCGWLSCMWVNPILRGKGIAKQLLATAFKTWDDHILVTEFTPEAKGLYDRSQNFNDLRTNEGLRCYLRFNLHEVLPKKSEKYKRYTPLLRIADTIANLPNAIRLIFYKATKSSSLQFTEVTEIDSELNDYILSKSQNSFELRDADDLNWVIKYPWLIESQPTEESRRYHFSSVAEKFENICVKISDNGKLKGFLHLTIRDGHLKVRYAYFEIENLSDVIGYIYGNMLSQKLSMLTVFQKDIVAYLRANSTPFIYKRDIKRNYIITKALDAQFSDMDKLVIQEGDADCAFT